MSQDGPITAGQEPEPLLSERLHGSGVAAWVLRPEDLDRLGVLTTAPRVLTQDAQDPADVEWPRPGVQELPAPPLSASLDPYRTPDGDVGPDAPLTLSYRELRRLIALHLAQVAHTMPRERGWLYAEQTARAMADGESPLRLREVLE